MRSTRRFAFALGVALLTAACDTVRIADQTGEDAWTSVSPSTAILDAIGATIQLGVVDANGVAVAVSDLTWRTIEQNVVVVDASGETTAIAPGTTRVVVETAKRADTAAIEVRQGIATISVTPATAAVQVTSTVQLIATLLDRKGHPISGRQVTWTSSDENIALVTATGLVMGRAAGSATITASSGGKAGSSIVTVTAAPPPPPPPPAPVATVTVMPSPATVQIGSTVQLAVTLRDASGNILGDRAVSWSTSASGIATVSASGLASGIAAGIATISATSEGKTGSVSVTVTPVPIASITVSPATGALEIGQTIQLTATARDANGNALTGRSIAWSTSNATVAQVSPNGLVTGAAAGSATITATGEGKSGSASITVSVVPVATVTVAPSTGTIQTGQTIQLTATLRDASGNTLTGRSVSWQSSSTLVALVSASGLVTGQAAGSATITATSEGKSGTATVTVSAPPPPPPPPAGSIDVRLSRLASGVGPVLVSSGIPLPPGRLRAPELATLKVLVSGQEPAAVYVEALTSTHPDGSLRAVLVQFNHDVPAGSGLTGQIVFGQPRNAPALPKPTVARGNPAAVILPFDPGYLISTDLVGPTLPAATAATISAAFQKYEADFRTYADVHWNAGGAAWTENYYDRALIYFAWWVRTGEVEYWRRASLMAVAYRRDYLEINNYGSTPHWAQLEGLEKHYLLTGDEASRYAVARVAQQFRAGYHRDGDPNSLGSTAGWWDNRIQARVLHSYLLSWRLQATGTAPLDWAALMESALPLILSTQKPDGSYRFDQLCGESLNYMTGLLNDAMIKYYTYYKPDARIPTAIRRSVDYLWTTQWIPTSQAFKYLSGTCTNVGGPTAAPDLNNLMVTGFGWTFRHAGDATYRDRGDQIFAGGVAGAYIQGSKQFNEEYSASFRHSGMR